MHFGKGSKNVNFSIDSLIDQFCAGLANSCSSTVLMWCRWARASQARTNKRILSEGLTFSINSDEQRIQFRFCGAARRVEDVILWPDVTGQVLKRNAAFFEAEIAYVSME